MLESGPARRPHRKTADKDIVLGQWLFEGAPAGYTIPVPGGPYFPPSSDPEGAAVEDILSATRNHPSFDACYGEKTSPGMQQAMK